MTIDYLEYNFPPIVGFRFKIISGTKSKSLYFPCKFIRCVDKQRKFLGKKEDKYMRMIIIFI